MTQYLIVLFIGLLSGYLIGTAGLRYQRTNEIQRLIDIEATKRKADGLYRKGDDLTETEPVESGVISTREVRR
jgi:hypothetical protein